MVGHIITHRFDQVDSESAEFALEELATSHMLEMVSSSRVMRSLGARDLAMMEEGYCI